ncbi:hypothetical protein ACQEVF_23740 [Nonomuraea polychroma]|uniref:hypothetical protein n=1 Tax=Nonomuraea polychroma TaxID=46176 RepID=UPI003D9458B2
MTDLEQHPHNVMSTANLFNLPAFCQYGVGGPASAPGAPPVADGHADIDRTVAYWESSPAVRDRLEAVASASASIVLFSNTSR